MKKYHSILNAVILAGIVLLFLGLFYLVIKAGIPYQDPTPAMQTRYAVNMEIGDTLTKIGAGMTLTGAALKFILSRIRRAIPDKKH